METQNQDKIRKNTTDAVNQKIDRSTEENLRHYNQMGPAQIADRIDKLDQEWDVDRVLMADASTLSLAGIALGASVDRRWYALSGVVVSFLLVHAIQGWCPPLPLFRRMGYRSRKEIDVEKYALKGLWGDFNPQQSPPEALQAAVA